MATSGARSFLLSIGADPVQGIRHVMRKSEGMSLRTRMMNIGLRYNEVHQESVHNAYNGDEGLYDQLIFWRARSIELDIHKGKSDRSEVPGDWYVYHYDDGVGPGGQTTCVHLSDALIILDGFHRAVPRHEVFTVFVDLKDAFDNGDHSADRFDTLVSRRLADHVYTPGDFLRGKESLRDAIIDFGWPELEQLRGKFLFVLTGEDDYLNGYATPWSRLAFIAPEINQWSDLSKSSPIYSDSIFFNSSNNHLSDIGNKSIRRYFPSDYIQERQDWDAAVLSGFQHNATNLVNSMETDWACTHDDCGYPFKRISNDVPQITPNSDDPGAVWSAIVDSGDIWGQQDSFGFVYHQESNDRTYTAYLASPNSHVERWAKVGLMARASLTSNSPYFAVIRPADQHGIYVQYRTDGDQDTEDVDIPIAPPDTIEDDTLIFVRLKILGQGRSVTGWASVSGRDDDWKLIYQRTFTQPLSLRGICASSHGNDPVQFIVGFIGWQPNLDKQSTISSDARLVAYHRFYRWPKGCRP